MTVVAVCGDMGTSLHGRTQHMSKPAGRVEALWKVCK